MLMKKILVLAPHTDDGELGCGGTISRLLREESDVYYCAFSTAKESLPEGMPENTLELEVKEATKRLGINGKNLFIHTFPVRKLNFYRQDILEILIKLKTSVNPDTIFLPSPNDQHQDHLTVAAEGCRAFKDRTILAYELPWNNFEFKNQCFIKLGEEDVRRKIYSLNAYDSQKHRRYMSCKYIESWAITRGASINEDFAECFEVIRSIF